MVEKIGLLCYNYNMDKKITTLPAYFQPILWSYKWGKISPIKHRQAIIVQAINYGDLRHWRWIKRYYGEEEVREVLRSISATELRVPARMLAGAVFKIQSFNDVPRGTTK